MNIKILDSWLREHLDTKATPHEIAKYLSLSGPSFETTKKVGNDYLYDIEVTTNRVDMMSVRGIAREAQAILPTHGIKAKLKHLNLKRPASPKRGNSLIVVSNKNLTRRTMGIVLTNLKNRKSPAWMKKRLEASGIRSLDAVVDITNYVMLEVGHPSHVFDFDKIPAKRIVIRTSKKGEKIVGLDGKTYSLPGDDIVFDDGKGTIIDLPGILGTKNSVVDKDTQNVLFFLDNNDPVRTRRTSMSLGLRTNAATLNEKNVDPYLAEEGLLRGIELFEKVVGAKVASKIFDSFPARPKVIAVETSLEFLSEMLGSSVTKKQVDEILMSLEFRTQWSGSKLKVTPPSWRAADWAIPEDVLEEIARIYGYHNLEPAIPVTGFPKSNFKKEFKLERKLKRTLQNLGGVEVYTISLVPKEYVGKNAVKIKNPLGSDGAYLRTSLKPSLLNATKANKNWASPYHLFEVAKVFKANRGDLPEEIYRLSGVFKDYSFSDAKGILESFLNALGISSKFSVKNTKKILIHSNEEHLGHIEIGEDFLTYQFSLSKLLNLYKEYPAFNPIPKFPPQVEDITITISGDQKVGEVMNKIKSADKLVHSVELNDVYKSNYTFRVSYLHPEKTLIDKEVEKVRIKIEKLLN